MDFAPLRDRLRPLLGPRLEPLERAYRAECPDPTPQGLLRHLLDADPTRFQPMNVNFGLLPPLVPHVRDKRVRKEGYAARALDSIRAWRPAG